MDITRKSDGNNFCVLLSPTVHSCVWGVCISMYRSCVIMIWCVCIGNGVHIYVRIKTDNKSINIHLFKNIWWISSIKHTPS